MGYIKKTKKRPVKRRVKRSRKNSIYRVGMKAGTLFPPKFRTTFKSLASFYSTVANGNKEFTFYIDASNPALPYVNSIGLPAIGACGNITGGFTLLAGAGPEVTTTLQFTGYQKLITLYSSYKVISTKIRITLQPSSQVDAGVLVLFPVNYETALAVPVNTFSQAGGLPYAKTKMISVNNDIKSNSISSHARNNQILGVTPSQYNALLPYEIGVAVPLANQSYWGVMVATNDNVAFTTVVALQIEYLMEVEYSGLDFLLDY